jgi:hypothetical protein
VVNKRELLKDLDQTSLPHLRGWEMIGGSGDERTGAETASLVGHAAEVLVDHRQYVKIPVAPTGYTMTWLIGPADSAFLPPDRVAVLLNFSGNEGAETEKLVIPVWARETDSPWVVVVEGPVNRDDHCYELTSGHVWRDAVEASARAIEKFGKSRRVGLFHYAPVELAFAVGSQFREMTPYRLYQFTRGKNRSGAAYVQVYDRWGT